MSETGSILVVDDEPGIRDVCERTLRALSFEVASAPDGQSALRLLEERDFDFVLTDLTMPGPVNGEKVALAVKEKNHSTDVVIMTAYPTLETAVELLKNGAYDYLTKPFSQELLESVVARCFEKRRLSQELNSEKRQRRELSAAYAELQKVEQLKESILSRLSHELRTPVCSSLLALEALQAASPKAETPKHYEIMRSSLLRLQKTVEDLLTMAQCRRGPLELRRSPTKIKDLIEAAVKHYEPLWREKRLRVETELAGLDEPLDLDAGRIEAAFKQLLLNAIQFNKAGGLVSIRGRRRPDSVQISFADTGAGIPEEKLPRIFDGFYQAAEYLTRTVGGLGLGLAIVRRIAEAHDGSIRVDSREGQGSTFTLDLPLQAVKTR